MTIKTKAKSHPRVTYLGTNNFYGQAAINAAYGSNLKSVKSNKGFYSKKYQTDNLAKNLHTNNQQKCIDCLKPISNKNERECKKCGSNYFYVANY